MRSFSSLQLLQISGICAVVCSVLVGATYLHAQWSGPTGAPPSSNVAAPINTSGSVQSKEVGGRIGADQMVAFDRMRSDLYCDLGGEKCFSANDIQAMQQAIDGLDESPGSSDLDLFNGLHSSQQCENLGGEVMTDGEDNRFCRLNSNSCPSGWSQYENWRTASSQTCQATGPWCSPCTTGSSPWSNSSSIPTCEYVPFQRDRGTGNGMECVWSDRITCSATITQIGCY